MSSLLRCVLLLLTVVVAHAVDVYFTPASISIARSESSTSDIVLTVTRNVTSGPLVVHFTVEDNDTVPERRATTSGGGADFSIDPVATPTGTLSFVDQQASATITIELEDDAIIEGYEYIRVRLLDLADYDVIGAASTSLITIADEDLTASVINLFPVASEDPNLVSPNHDPGAARRGVIQVLFNDESWFDKSVSATFAGNATGSDYKLAYRIGGGGMGTALGWTIAAYPEGTSTITVTGGGGAIAMGTPLTIRGQSYTVATAFSGTGALELTPALTTAIMHGDPLVIPSMPAATYTVSRNIIVGTTSLTLGSGYGGALQYGDVFYFGTLTSTTARYVVTQDPDANDTFEFRRYEGGTTANTGLDVAITTTATMQVMFSATAPGIVSVLIPAESTQIQYGVTPGNGVTANDGAVEGREFVTMGVALSNEYLVTSPTTGGVIIADVDSKASIELTRDAVHPEVTGIATVTLTPPIPQQVTVPYAISGGDATQGVDYTISGTLTIPANTATGQIVITPLIGATIPVGGQTVILALDSSDDYQRTTGPITSSVATVTILPTTGTVTVSKSDGAEGGSDGNFRIAIARFAGHSEAATVNYAITGTANNGTDYATLSGSAVIPANAADNFIDVAVDITNDALVEGPETAILTLTAGTGYVLGTTTAATVTIADNEPTATVAATVNTAVEGGATGSFTITMTPAPSANTTVPFTYSGEGVGNFTANPTALQVVFASGETTKTVIITADDDALVDGDRTLTLTLTAPTAPATYSLGTTANANLTLADNDEGVVVVDATSLDGDYALGDEILLTVEFSTAVTVTGTPQLILDTGILDHPATYLSGSGSDTLVFRYQVQSGDSSSDLDYASSGALILAGGTITHGAGSTAILTLPAPGAAGSLASNAALRISGTLGAGKPSPGAAGEGSGGGCGLGSGFAALIALCMLTGIALSIRRNRP